MKLSYKTIQVLAKIVTGDSGKSPYRSGPKLVSFFNNLGLNDDYGQGFPSRWYYAEESIKKINGSGQVIELFNQILDSRDYIDTEFSLEAVVKILDECIKFDGYEIVESNGRYLVQDLSGAIVAIENKEIMDHAYISTQIEKCRKKIVENDYDGAITNARTLVESELIEIIQKIEDVDVKYDGDLIKLYKRAQTNLKLEPSRKDITGSLRQILSGLISIINGLSSLRNKMGDAHASSFAPSKHHAKLAVNCAHTFVSFIYDSYNYQESSEKKKDADTGFDFDSLLE